MLSLLIFKVLFKIRTAIEVHMTSSSMHGLLQVVFELLCNIELIPEWDMLFKGAKYLSYATESSDNVEVAYIHLVYGLPGELHHC